MNIINAGLWAVANYDLALQPLVELRQKFATDNTSTQLKTSLDRVISVYLNDTSRDIHIASGLSTIAADRLIHDTLGDVTQTCHKAITCTDDPLIVELLGYTLILASLSNCGTAPWSRFAEVIHEHFDQKFPNPHLTGASA